MKRYSFNLIEIILTVAVIAFGVVVILGMLPKGLSASRNAGMQSYASEIIDQMASYLQANGASGITPEFTTDTAEKNFIDSFVSDDTTDRLIMNSYPKLAEYNDLSQTLPGSLSSDFSRTNTAGVFQLNGSHSYEESVYIIVMGDTYTDDVGGDHETETRIDFSGMLRVWKRPRAYESVRVNDSTNYFSKTDAEKEGDFKLEVPELPLGASGNIKGATVCMELSYPLSLPYDQRTKRYYSFEVGE